MQLFLFSIVVTAISAQVHNENSRILNGDVAQPHSYPFMVLVRPSYLWCGGTIIREDAILTSAQCLPSNVSEVEIYIGGHDFGARETSRTRRWSREIIRHEDWTETNKNLYDIAIIILSENITFNEHATSIALDQKESMSGLIPATVAGWGRQSQTDTVLSYINGFIVTQRLCEEHCGVPDHSTLLCFHNYNKKSLTRGDAGGPVFETRDGSFYQLGIFSYVGESTCEVEDQTAVFTRVARFNDWINSKLPTYV